MNRNGQKPVDSCFFCYLFDISVKNTEAVTQRRSAERCSQKLTKIHRKAPVPKPLQAGGLQLCKKDFDQGFF